MRKRYFLGVAAFGALLLSCTQDKSVTSPGSSPGKPQFSQTVPFNNEGRCLSADAFFSGFTTGLQDSLTLSDPTKSCTSQDIKIARAVVQQYSTDGITFIPFTGQNISCNDGDPIIVTLAAEVQETATSARTDVGIWIATDAGNARTGTCNHYNLVNGVTGVSDVDSDHCGDMNNADSVLVPLGNITTICHSSPISADSLHVGSCLGWTVPGNNQVCPQPAKGETPDGYRFGTVPSEKSKCNCDGFNLPITVRKTAKLEVQKVCSPTTDGGHFDLLIDGTAAGTGAAAACGGTTGSQTVSAGTTASPGATHTFGEGNFTTANYTSSYACSNRSVSGPQHVFTASGDAAATGTSLGPNQITMEPGEDVICVYTNVRKPQVKVVKALVPTTDGGKFDFTIDGLAQFTNSGAGYGNNGTTGFQNVSVGSLTVSEAAHSGTSLTDYTSVLACVNASNASVTVGSNTGTSGSITVAAGDQITCTFTNSRKPQVKVVKALVPSTDGGKFDFTIDGLTPFDNSGAGYGNNGTTGFQNVSAGSLTVSEAAHSGTSLTDYTSVLACVNASNASVTVGSNTGTSGSITVAAGDQITCTFTNSRKPQVKLVKVLNPTTDGGKFDLTIGANTFNNGGAGYGNNGTTGFQNVSVGSVTVSEAAHTGTSISDYGSQLACVNASNASVTVGSNTGTSGSITVAAGDQITCTFTNTNGPQVKLVKALVPTTDGGKFDFAIGASSFNNGGAGYGNNGTTGFQAVSIGSVSVGESAHTGTSLTDYNSQLACVNAANASVTVSSNTGTGGSISVGAGDRITCTFTNTRKPQIKLVKALVPTTDAGTFDLTIGGNTFNNGGAGYGNNGNTGFQNVAIGPVGISEAAHTGTTLANYTSQLACVNAANQTVSVGSNTGTAGSVTVAAGDQITCTFTNSRIPQVKLIKALVPTTDAGTFDLTIGANSFNNGGAGYGNNGTTGFQNVSVGGVSISEGAHTGTTQSDYTSVLACVNASNASVTVGSNTGTSGSITVAAGDQITCTFTNTRKPRLKVVKAVVPTTDPGKFDLSIGATTFNNGGAGFGDGGNTGFQTLSVGPVSVGEAAHTGTTLSDYTSVLACVNAANASVTVGSNTGTSGSVTLGAGDVITCTFTNTRNTGKLELKKVLVPTTSAGLFNLLIKAGGSGGSTVASATNIGNNGTTGSGGTTLNTGVYNLSETAGTNTSLTDYFVTGPACVNRGDNSSVSVSTGNVTLAKNADVVCTITNTEKSTIIIQKIFPTNNTQTFTFTRTLAGGGSDGGNNPAPTLTNGGSSSSGKLLAAGSYKVCETGLPVAFLDPTFTDNNVSVTATGDGLGDFCVTFTLGAGDTQTIVVTNAPPPGGGTRTIGYWKNWSSCAQSNGGQYTKAINAGHPEEVLDTYLVSGSSIYPIGNITSLTCDQAVNLLAKNAIDGTKRSGDPIYNMVAQLLGAKLNVAANAGTCAALNTALGQAQTLLVAIGFDGLGSYKSTLTSTQTALANSLNTTLTSYNEGTLGQGCPTHI